MIVDPYICGFSIFVGPNLISWIRRIAYGLEVSTEAKYKVLTNGAAEAIWIESLLGATTYTYFVV
jgi:hypothetical protein